jgi:hypothetical protein
MRGLSGGWWFVGLAILIVIGLTARYLGSRRGRP